MLGRGGEDTGVVEYRMGYGRIRGILLSYLLGCLWVGRVGDVLGRDGKG